MSTASHASHSHLGLSHRWGGALSVDVCNQARDSRGADTRREAVVWAATGERKVLHEFPREVSKTSRAAGTVAARRQPARIFDLAVVHAVND